MIKSCIGKAGRVLAYPFLAACLSSSAAAQVQGWQASSGVISFVNLSYETNFAFRFTITNNGVNPLASTCQNGFVYLNKVAGENYEAKVATLLQARALRANISFNYVIEANGFCRMTDMNF